MPSSPSCLRDCAVVRCRLVCLRASTPSPPPSPPPLSPLPPELAAPVAAALAPEVVTVTTGTTKLEFWWVKSLPLRAGGSGAPSWADVPDGSLVGALRLGADWRDIRGLHDPAGVYTLRFALQPQNGDHMGISPNREFLLPAPAADDVSADPVGYDGAVALARKSSRRAHPASISIDPPGSSEPAAVGDDQRSRPSGRHRQRPDISGAAADLRHRRRRHDRPLATEPQRCTEADLPQMAPSRTVAVAAARRRLPEQRFMRDRPCRGSRPGARRLAAAPVECS